VDALGNEKREVFRLGYVNAINQSGKKNSIDSAIVKHISTEEKDTNFGQVIGEIPFNFEARRSSCIVKTPSGRLSLICKGAFEEVSSLCCNIRLENEIVALNSTLRDEFTQRVAAFNSDGYRVIVVATRHVLDHELVRDDYRGLDRNMTVEGLLTFLDPPKDDAKASIQRLQELGVDVRVLTGDNLGVALKVCRTLELVQEVAEEGMQTITGPDLASLEGTEEFDNMVKRCKIFAKLTPTQKGQVITSLKGMGEVVGMLGDGINDCVALRFADAGISVDSGMNVAKDCADVILTQKELSIIVDCVITGRITHGNTYVQPRPFFSYPRLLLHDAQTDIKQHQVHQNGRVFQLRQCLQHSYRVVLATFQPHELPTDPHTKPAV
jgi:P-type Mg2+ transporter